MTLVVIAKNHGHLYDWVMGDIDIIVTLVVIAKNHEHLAMGGIALKNMIMYTRII